MDKLDRMKTLLLCGLISTFCAASLRAQDQENPSRIAAGFCETFDDGNANGWSPKTPSRWSVDQDGNAISYHLKNAPSTSNGILGDYSIYDGFSAKDFNFNCRARTAEDISTSPRADIVLVFEYINDLNYKYVVYSKDVTITNISMVVNGVRSYLVSGSSAPVVRDELYHGLRLSRTGNQIQAFYDGTLVISATDPNPVSGKLGVSSLNDRAYYDEVNVGNSCTSRPDLDVTAVTSPASANAGQSITVGNSVKNQESANAGSFRVGIYLSSDNVIELSDLFLGSRTVNSLAGGVTSSGNTNVTITSGIANGTYYIGVYADDQGHVSEENENNNTASQVVTIGQQLPDLVVSSLSAPSSANAGNNINVSNAVYNQGNASAGSFRVGIYLSTDNVIQTSDEFLGSRTVGSLAAGGTSSSSTTVSIPGNTAGGGYYIGVYADDQEQVHEVAGNNNTASQAITILPVQQLPDLVVSSFSASSSANPGDNIVVSNSVYNQGSAGAGSFRLGIYLSTDNFIQTSDVFLGSRTVGSLAVGGTSSSNTAVVIPGNTTAGSYYLGVYADDLGQVQEVGGNNNMASSPIHISTICITTWQANLTVRDAGSNSMTLTFGQGLTATNDLDTDCGEADLPPVPPAGVFDARFELPVSPVKASLKDYRNDSEQAIDWRVKFQPGASGAMVFSWNSANFPAGRLRLKDEITGTLIDVNMRTQNSYTLTNTAITSLRIEYSNQPCPDVNVISDWNIVSVPVLAQNMNVNSLFPTAISPAFAFNNGYVSTTTLQNGVGYWIKFGSPGPPVQICGSPVSSPNIPVNSGWNIIGPFGSDVQVAAITSTPSGIVCSNYFGYNNGYTSATILIVGKGYWVKICQAGVLHLPSTSSAAKTWEENIFASREVNPSWPMIVVQDRDGNVGRLYLSPATEIDDVFDLPPLPPAGIFDVRFSNDAYVTSRQSGDVEILLSAAKYPVRMRAQNLGPNVSLRVKDNLDAGVLNESLAEGTEIVIAERLNRIVLETEQVAQRYDLSQNHPNPFNPTTVVKFSLPEKSYVKVTVYNLLGERVSELVNREMDAGDHQINVDAQGYSAGVYFYAIEAGSFKDVKKMMVVK